MSLLAFSSVADAKIQPGGGNWSEWRGLGKGFVARRREAPPPDLEKVVKRMESRNSVARKGLLKDTSADALWLKTQEEGLYKLDVTELAAWTGQSEAKLRRWAKKGRQLALSNRGMPVAWHYDEASDAVYFAAEAVDTLFTDTNAFRLSKNNKATETMDHVAGPGPATGVPQDPFLDTVKFEEEPEFMYAPWVVQDDPEADYWFWNYLLGGYVDTLEIPLDLPDAAETGQGEVRVVLRGFNDFIEGDDHRVRLELNDVPIGEPIEWDGFAVVELVAPFDHGVLQADNALRLVTEYEPGTFPGQYLDEISVSYWRYPVAIDDQLWLRGLPPGEHTVDGFTSGQVVVVESPVGAARWRSDITVEPVGDGTYSVTFLAESSADYLVVGDNAVNAPVVEEDSPSRLATPRNRADYLIVAPRELAQTAEDLRDYRSSDFSRVQIAWYDDIVEEFNHGIDDPKALTDFLAYVKENWRRAPAYVTLVGAGKLDHKDRLGYGGSFLPVKMATTPWGLAPSDNRYMDVNGDGLMDFAYGRIPVSDDADGLGYLAKLEAYEAVNAVSDRVVLVADNPDDAGDFHANSNELSSMLETYGYDITKLYHPSTPSVRDGLTTSAMWEAAYISYDGHGSAQQIGAYNNGENFLTVADVAGLNNEVLPVFAAMTCAAADSTQPGIESLAAALTLKRGGGAIASFAPTGLSLDTDAHVMSQAFADALIGGKRSIADAVKEAQYQSAGSVNDFMLQIYQVVGEPLVYVP